MSPRRGDAGSVSRRDAIAAMIATGAALAVTPVQLLAGSFDRHGGMRAACLVRYRIDPQRRDAFGEHARRMGTALARCGGRVIGFFLPYAGANDEAWAMVAFESLTACESCRARMTADPGARDAAASVRDARVILGEEWHVVQLVEGTFDVRATS